MKSLTKPNAYLDMTSTEVRDVLTAGGHKAFGAKQLADWVYDKGVTKWRARRRRQVRSQATEGFLHTPPPRC